MDVLVVVGTSVAVGAVAPRWPDSWLRNDLFPLVRMPWESVERYRRWGLPRLARVLPELGSAFGGRSKSAIPGRSTAELTAYLYEVRRAEWVHWWSVAWSFVLLLFNPFWLAAAFIVAVTLGNLPFILILRNNRFRLQSILDRSQSS